MIRYILSVMIVLGLLVNIAGAADEAKKKKAGVKGTITKVDAEKGVITVKVALKKKQFEDKEFKITDKSVVTAPEGTTKAEIKASKQPLSASSVKELLSKPQFKVGAAVTIDAEDNGTVKTMQIGTKKKKAAK